MKSGLVLLRSLLLGTALLGAAVGHAAQPSVNTLGEARGFLSKPKPTGIAIRGYDPVAYHTLGTPTPGVDAHQTEYQGAIWKFASAEHLALFTSDPERYAPAYGGYCAYGVAKGALVKIEPDQWQIVDGRLYLNFDADIAKKWSQDVAGFIAEADRQFPTLLQQ